MKSGCNLDLGMTDTDSFLFKVSDTEKVHGTTSTHIWTSQTTYHLTPNLTLQKSKVGLFQGRTLRKIVLSGICWSQIKMLCYEFE
jgi:hypothetical protein